MHTAPELLGRKQEVDRATVMIWNQGRWTNATIFNQTCAGGCITIVSVSLQKCYANWYIYQYPTYVSS